MKKNIIFLTKFVECLNWRRIEIKCTDQMMKMKTKLFVANGHMWDVMREMFAFYMQWAMGARDPFSLSFET